MRQYLMSYKMFKAALGKRNPTIRLLQYKYSLGQLRTSLHLEINNSALLSNNINMNAIIWL